MILTYINTFGIEVVMSSANISFYFYFFQNERFERAVVGLYDPITLLDCNVND